MKTPYVGAQSENERLATLMTNTVCYMQDNMKMIEEFSKMDFTKMTPEDLKKKQDEMEAKGKEADTKIKGFISEQGFKNEGEVEEKVKNMANKDAFKEDVKKKIQAKCTPDQKIMDSFFSEVFK